MLHLYWLEKYYPTIFDGVKAAVSVGRIVVEGGLWVEMDCNIPNGESFTRQILFGQNYCKKTFGHYCNVFWLPDTFGYNSQLPQIIKQGKMKYFFTQKLSWNLVNTFPYSTFSWIGLDKSSVLTHFCPAESYCSRGLVDELHKAINNNKQIGISPNSMYLYG